MNHFFKKMLMLGVAFGATVSGTVMMTAAIGNILAVDLFNRLADIHLTYFQWFIYLFPSWLILTPALWFLLIKMFPLQKEHQVFPKIEAEMGHKLTA